MRAQGLKQGLKQKLPCLLKHWIREVSCFRPGYVRTLGKGMDLLKIEDYQKEQSPFAFAKLAALQYTTVYPSQLDF